MTLRKVVFWLHLIVAVSTGLVILLMSVTGVLLAYEKQVLAWAGRSFVEEASLSGGSRLPLNTLIAAAKDANGGRAPSSLTFYAGSAAVAAATSGPTIYVDSVSGKVLGSAGTAEFFKSVRSWHRYLGMSGNDRAIGRSITHAITLVFVLLVVAGAFLWFPHGNIWFKSGLKGKARNWNWHNVFGFWAAIPLFLVLISGVVISYDWATNIVYRIAGTDPPVESDGRVAPRSNLAKIDPLLAVVEQQAMG